MGLQDAVRRLTENQEEPIAAKDEGGEQVPPVEERKEVEPISSAETDRLEKLLFKFAAMIEKDEAERQEMKKLAQEVDTQKDTVGKMLVSLDKVIQDMPNAVNASVKSSIDQHTAHIAQATTKITGEMDRQASSIATKVVKILNDCFATSVAGIKTAASQAETAASSMEVAKNYVGWRIIAVNIGVSLLVVFILLGAVNRRFPWQLGGPTSQERTYIERGKALSKTWSQLPPKVQSVISQAINENE